MTIPFYVPPEQLMKDRAEYARKGIARGKSIVAVEFADGVVLLGENPSGTLQKISEIYDHIAFAGVGKYTEFEQLRVGGIRRADLTGYAYSRDDVTAKSLANAYAQTLGHVFTQDVKPFEVEVMVVEIGDADEQSHIYRVTYDGTLYEETRLSAIGGSADDLVAHLDSSYSEGGSLADALGWAKAACTAVAENGVTGWEAAVLDRSLGRRAFRRLTDEEIEAA
ncbi:MAG TPA: proteasome subunit alpha [Acidimicrobiia bacterium]|nr:proteasome subunit alpha [Acidimicrobiia bacterium]